MENVLSIFRNIHEIFGGNNNQCVIWKTNVKPEEPDGAPILSEASPKLLSVNCSTIASTRMMNAIHTVFFIVPLVCV
jgi:hypothetical protein